MNNEQSILDTRRLLSGKDGRLFVTTSSGTQIFLAEVDDFTASLNINNTDYQPVGSALSFAVPTGYTISLTLVEAVVRDHVMLKELIDDLRNGKFPFWDFQGAITRSEDEEERQIFRNCIPDGQIDLMNLKPGEIIKRNWNFRVNGMPEYLSLFKTEV